MKLLKFHKTECGVDFLLNVLHSDEVKSSYVDPGAYGTDCFEIIIFKKGKGDLVLISRELKSWIISLFLF